MSTIDLINAIESGDSEAIEKNFQELMADRVSERLDDKRAELAQSMFKTPEASSEEVAEEETATEE